MRVVRAIAGILLLTAGLPALLVGGALWALMQQRNASGAFAVALERVDNPGHAVVVPDLDALLSRDAPFTRASQTRLQISAHTSDGPAFVGLAPAADVARYLAAAPYVTVDRVAVSAGPLPVRVTSVPPAERLGPGTDALPGPNTPPVVAAPGERSFWVQRGLGALDWAVDDIRGKQLSLVIMHPDAATGGMVNLRAEVRPGWLDPTTWGLLVGGGILVVLAMVLLAWPVRPREVVVVAEPDPVPLPTPPVNGPALNDLGQPNPTAPRARDAALERVAPLGLGTPRRFGPPVPSDAARARSDAAPALAAAPVPAAPEQADQAAPAPAAAEQADQAAPAPAAAERAPDAAVDVEAPAALGNLAPAVPAPVTAGPVLPVPPRPPAPAGAVLSQPPTEVTATEVTATEATASPEGRGEAEAPAEDGVMAEPPTEDVVMAEAPGDRAVAQACPEDDGSGVDSVTVTASPKDGVAAAPADDDGSDVDAATAEVSAPAEAEVSVAGEAASAQQSPEPAILAEVDPASPGEVDPTSLGEVMPARPEGAPAALPVVNPAPLGVSLSWPPPSPSRSTLPPAPIVPARFVPTPAGTEGVRRQSSRLKGCRSGSTDVSVPAGNTVPEVDAGNARRRNDAKRDSAS